MGASRNMFYHFYPNESCKKFIAILTSIYHEFFPENRIMVRHNKNSTPWITRGIAKSSKCRQKLYEKFLINCTSENEMNYKNYRKLSESVKQKSKIFFLLQTIQFQRDGKKTSRILKEVIGKARKTQSLLPRKIIVNNLEINEEKQIQ